MDERIVCPSRYVGPFVLTVVIILVMSAHMYVLATPDAKKLRVDTFLSSFGVIWSNVGFAIRKLLEWMESFSGPASEMQKKFQSSNQEQVSDTTDVVQEQQT